MPLMPWCHRDTDQAPLITADIDEEDEEGRAAQAAAWDSFWGFDCIQAAGVCERVYSQLGLPSSSFSGLKVLPEVSLVMSPFCHT